MVVDFAKYENGEIFSPLQRRMIELLEKNGPMTRADLIKSADSPRTTVYDSLVRLQNYNLVRKFSRPTNTRGRPLVFFKLTSE